ncbi:MAG: hypothetical protein EXR71_13250 [Myxococcales bacterium]|nr:hypothetical protein [Myxococcales bacterium]
MRQQRGDPALPTRRHHHRRDVRPPQRPVAHAATGGACAGCAARQRQSTAPAAQPQRAGAPGRPASEGRRARRRPAGAPGRDAP